MAVAALMAAGAGVCYASYVGYVFPGSFSPMESALLLAVVIIGGPGRLWGPVIGATILVCVPEGLRFVGFGTAQAANIRQILLGATFVMATYWLRVAKRRSFFLNQGTAT
jgi:branched-chain amino acid transport system permease protein